MANKVRAIRSDGARSRRTILEAAAKLATIEGLDGLSIGRLAEHIGMSKSGLFAHFGSKEELQLATIETAVERFYADVIEPAESVRDPLARIEKLCARFIDYLARRVFPGGCFFAAAAAEFDTHPGPVQDRIQAVHKDWLERIERLVEQAKAEGSVAETEDAAQVSFEIDSYLLMANMIFVLHNDSTALDRGMAAIRDRVNRLRLD